MSDQKYQRSVEELRAHASMFWPSELSQEEARLSVIPRLLQTQDEFVAIISVPVSDLDGLFKIIDASSFSGNLFVKHLTVLADFGGEQLQRANNNFQTLFPSGSMEFLWNGQFHSYQFQELPVPNLTNNRLGITGRKLVQERQLDKLLQDVVALLIFGSAATNELTGKRLSKCEIGDYLGRPEELKRFIKQRYIWVSRITMGAQSNSLGQLAQEFVRKYLQEHLSIQGMSVQSNGTIPGISHTDSIANRPTTFDIVVSQQSRIVAVEISFQVTTNSVIERKAGQAQARFNQVENAGHRIAYVLDGAGNFQRMSALSTICTHSHCTVAFSKSEIEILCDFIREHLA